MRVVVTGATGNVGTSVLDALGREDAVKSIVGVGSLVYASSVGAYSPGPKDRHVDEDWPTEGIPTAYYATQKADVERRLDLFELGWEPKRGADEALIALLDGIHDNADFATPPLASETGGPLRVKELLTGIGSRP